MKRRMILVSNRLPVSAARKKGKIAFSDSIGGLATALGSFYQQYDSIWVGWPGMTSDRLSPADKKNIIKGMKERKCQPVFIKQRDFDLYYLGFSNKTIWPLFHYFVQYLNTDPAFWDAYVRVNRAFADEIIKIARPDDTIWVHDYHFMLLPEMIREKLPNVSIGYFLHIPFPSSEVFRLLPWREELLKGLLGADLIGFHIYDYVHHFLNSVRRLLGYDNQLGLITLSDRMVKVNAFPIGIDYNNFESESQSEKVIKEKKKIRDQVGDRKIIVSMDRLDYTKGIPNRLKAYDRFLEKYPKYKEKVTLIMVASPSRENVETYKALKAEVEGLVGSVNGKHTRMGWIPIWYIHQKIPFSQLVALYNVADVALVTPVRDGMNLMAKEFLATKTEHDGVLVLSELAGAAKEMGEALIINPNNLEQMSDTISQALTMPLAEQKKRNLKMQRRIRRYTANKWAMDFMTELEKIKTLQNRHRSKRLSQNKRRDIIDSYSKAGKRLIMLDYDGTLVPFQKSPEEAIPDRALLRKLKRLCQDRRNEVLIISGRDKSTLEEWFGKLPLSIIAEHGVWLKGRGKSWRMIEPLNNAWKELIHPVLDSYVMKTPGSFVEEKGYSLAWHYRKADQDQARAQIAEMKPTLIDMTQGLDVGILEGNKVIEVKSQGVSKGRAAQKWLKRKKWDFILAIGDDWTDEDMFKVIPKGGYTVRVGFTSTAAKYNVRSFEDVRSILKSLK